MGSGYSGSTCIGLGIAKERRTRAIVVFSIVDKQSRDLPLWRLTPKVLIRASIRILVAWLVFRITPRLKEVSRLYLLLVLNSIPTTSKALYKNSFGRGCLRT